MRVLRESWLICTRALRPTLRNPVVIVMSAAQPAMYLAFFGPLLHRLTSAPGFPPGDAWQVYVPALLVQLGLFGATYAGFGLIPEIRAGVVERMRVTPVSRTALLFGRVLRDVVVLLVQAVLLLAAALLAGLRAPVGGVLLGLVLVALVGTALAAVSYTLALRLPNEYAFAPTVSNTTIPLMLLSGLLLPMSLAPAWLRAVYRVNPLGYVVDAERALFRGAGGGTTVLVGAVVAVAAAALAVAWGIRAFRRENT
jgi:ABC-2 type transport system permease protein